MEAGRKMKFGTISIVNNNLELSTDLSELPTNAYGFYWIYTSYTLQKMINCTPDQKAASVKINERAKLHGGLSHICSIQEPIGESKFWLVYNGIGSPLRARILVEFGNGSKKTGSLAIRSTSINYFDKWCYSYLIIDKAIYNKYGNDFERLWRLEYGWPLLCRL